MPQEHESDNVAIVVTDLEGWVLHRSGLVEEMLGRPPAGRTDATALPDWFTAASRIDALEMLARCLDRGWAPEQQLAYSRSGEHELPLWVECSLVTDSEGTPTNVTWLLRDSESRLQLQAALEESQEKYRHLFESSPSGITLLSLEGEIIDCNPKALQIAGVPAEALIGQLFFSLPMVPPAERERLQAVPAELLQRNQPIHFEVQILRGGTEPIWIENFASLLSNDAKPYAIQFITRDITERKQIEQALKDSEARFRELADLLPQTVFEVDTAGKLTYVNREALRQFGYTRADFEAGLFAAQMFVEADRKRVIENIKKRLREELPAGMEYTAQRKDGSSFPVRTYTSVIRRNEEVVGLRGLVFDMTEISLTAEQLRQSEARFRTIAESMPLSMIITEPEDGQVLYANSRFKQEYGFSDEDLRTLKTPTQFANPDDRERMVAEIRREGHIKDYEIAVHRADGTLMTISVAAAPILYDGRQVLLAVLEDVTERRRVELAEREARDQLDATLKALPDLLFEVDQDGRIYNWHSSRAEDLYLSPEEFLGKRMAEVLPPEPAAIIAEALAEAKTTGRHRGATYALDIHGEKRWYELSIAAKGERTPEHSRFILTIRDVTERVVADVALRESEQRYRELQNNVPIGLFQSTVEGGIVFVNEAVVKMFGFDSAAEVLEHKAIQAYQDPADRELLLGELLATGTVKGFEALLKRRDGSTFWGSLNITAGHSTSGEVTHFDGTLTDITDRKLAEAALATSEQRYRLLVENIRMSIARISYDGEFMFVNQYGATRLGQRPQDLVGKMMSDAFPQKLAERQLASIREAIDNRETLSRESHVQIGDKWYWYSTTIQPYPDSDGETKSAMIMADDITERRSAEEELRLAHEGLKAEQQALVVKNIALKELLGQIDDEKQRIKQQIQANLDRVAIPMLEALSKKLPGDLRTTARVLEQCLQDIGSPYIGELESRFSTLTPREVEICNMIRNGLQSKEIGRELEISVRTVEKFRQQIRRKLGIVNEDTNLISFLRNL